MNLSDVLRRVVLFGLIVAPAVALAQPAPATGSPPSAAVSAPASGVLPGAITAAPSLAPRAPVVPAGTLLPPAEDECGPEQCCPPTMAEKLFIGVGGLALVLVFFFLFIRVLSSQAIKQGTSVLQARHRGIALALFLSTAGLAALFFFVTGCWPPQATLWVAFMGGVWLLHTIYALAVVRSK